MNWKPGKGGNTDTGVWCGCVFPPFDFRWQFPLRLGGIKGIFKADRVQKAFNEKLGFAAAGVYAIQLLVAFAYLALADSAGVCAASLEHPLVEFSGYGDDIDGGWLLMVGDQLLAVDGRRFGCAPSGLIPSPSLANVVDKALNLALVVGLVAGGHEGALNA